MKAKSFSDLSGGQHWVSWSDGQNEEAISVSPDLEKPASRTQWSTGLLFESGRKMGLPAADSSDA